MNSQNSKHLPDLDWQTKLKSQKECVAFLLNNELMSDVRFLVGGKPGVKRIPAHKLHLATRSPVFFKMFHGAMAKECEDNNEIEVPDAEPDSFVEMLRYIYYDDVKLSGNTVMGLLYASKKYILPGLTKLCVEFLDKELNPFNVCVVLKQSILFDEIKLSEKCLQLIDCKAEAVLKSDDFIQLDVRTLKLVIARDSLMVTEQIVFDAVNRWSEAECARQQLKVDSASKREVLGEALYLVRMPLMTPEEFAKGPVKSGILTAEEMVICFTNYFHDEQTDQLLFSAISRKPRVCALLRAQRYSSHDNASWTWSVGREADRIDFKVNEAISIAGFGCYGPVQQNTSFTVHCVLENQGKVMQRGKNQHESKENGDIVYQVMLEKPVLINPGVVYTAVISFEGAVIVRTFVGNGGRETVDVEDVSFTFITSKLPNNGTSCTGGQLPEILFHKNV